MVVTGILNLFSTKPSSTNTHLTRTAFKNTSVIYVGSSSGWKAEDSLAISSSFKNNEHEMVVIKSINTDGSITLKNPLKYTHYGSSSMTISNSYGTLDSRSKVGHITRNIKIVSGHDAEWGYNIIVYGKNTSSGKLVGSINFDGVELVNGGQLNTENGPLTFLDTIGGTTYSSVTASTFINCKTTCINFINARKIKITSSLIYNARVLGVQVKYTR